MNAAVVLIGQGGSFLTLPLFWILVLGALALWTGVSCPSKLARLVLAGIAAVKTEATIKINMMIERVLFLMNFS